MLRQSSDLIGYTVEARDGLIGNIADLLFDDRTWTLRWAVVDTGDWISGRQVLLPPSVFGAPDAAARRFPVDLTREQVENAPEIAEDEPVSRQRETELYSHYGWLPYWYPGYDPLVGAPGYPGSMPLPGGAGPAVPPQAGGVARVPPEAATAENPDGDSHLRSIGAVTEYYIHATDGDIGHIEEFLIDDADWSIRYFVVDTRNWWPGKMVLISPRWITGINWDDSHASVDLTREQVRSSPEYDPSRALERADEERLHRHYGAPNYWE